MINSEVWILGGRVFGLGRPFWSPRSGLARVSRGSSGAQDGLRPESQVQGQARSRPTAPDPPTPINIHKQRTSKNINASTRLSQHQPHQVQRHRPMHHRRVGVTLDPIPSKENESMAAYGSLKPGSGVEYYTQGAGGRAGGTNYYTGASAGSEPPGSWGGAKAEELGLTGDVDAAVMEAVYTEGKLPDGSLYGTTSPTPRAVRDRIAEKLKDEPDALPERVRQIEREAARTVRQGNTFVDYTFSPSKDITVAHTAAAWAEQQARVRGDAEGMAHWGRVRETIERITHDGNQVALAYLEKNAGYGRTGSNAKKDGSKIRYVPGDGFVAGTFFQHTSREGDPQLHHHNAILNAVTKPDGKVGKLDTALLYQERAAATAHGARYMTEKLAEELGWISHPRTDGNGHELDNVDKEVMDLFSERTKNITAGTDKIVADYVEQFGHEPPSATLARLKKQESLRQRPRKPGVDGPTRDEQLAAADAKMRATIGMGMARQAAKLTVQEPPTVADEFSPSAVVKQAVARCAEASPTFNKSDLKRAIEAELPSNLGCGVEGAFNLIEGLAKMAAEACVQVSQTVDHRLPDDFKHQDGTSAYQRPGSVKYASPDNMAAERALEKQAVLRGGLAVSELEAESWVATNAPELNLSQRTAVVGLLSSGANLTALQGPAGAGKTYVLGVASRAWKDLTGGRMIGLSVSEQATDVLRDAGLIAKNTAQFEAVQARLAKGVTSNDDLSWRVQENDILVLDESSMSETARVTKIVKYAQAGRVVLAGDTKQLAAVGAGGAMDLVVTTKGAEVYELTEPRRFANAWEAKASLDLREGKTEVADQYAMHDRIRDGGTESEAMKEVARLYVGDRLRGKSTVVVVASNQQAAAVNGAIREELVKLGRVDRAGSYLPRDGNTAGVGDIVKPRKTDWTPGAEVRNQGRYIVKKIHPDGGMTITEQGNPEVTKTVSKAFVDEWMELGYAGTAHSTQGATVDTAVTMVAEGMNSEGLYVGMSRGKERNTAVVVTQKEGVHPATEETTDRGHIDAAGVITSIMESDAADGRAALTQQREDVAQAKNMGTLTDMIEEATREHCRARTSTWLDRMACDDTITIEDRQRLAAEGGAEQLGRQLRIVEQAGHDPEQVLKEAVAEAPLDDAKNVAQVIQYRISSKYKREMGLDSAAASQPPVGLNDDYAEHLDHLGDMMSERRSELGAEQAAEPQPWATETLGPVPEDTFARMEWEERAGKIAGYREASGWVDEQEPLPHAPGISQTEQRAQWAEAWTAAGRPEANAPEHTMTEGALRNRVLAMQRENAAMPDSVYEEMKAVEQEIYNSQQAAARASAEADLAEDDLEAARLREQVAEHDDYADRFAAKRAQLQQVDDLRRELLNESAVTRDLGTRARRELENVRGVEIGQEPDRCTAEEWLASEAQARVEDDVRRPITEYDLAENQMMTNDKVDIEDGVVAASDQAINENVPTDLDVQLKLIKAREAALQAADRASLDADRQGREALWAGTGQAVKERTVEFADDDVAV